MASAGEKLSDLLNQLETEGLPLYRHHLSDCLKDFHKYRLYHPFLEIMEWMEKRRIGFREKDYALSLNVIYKLKGIDEVEEYFNSLPRVAKKYCTYATLLNCYCAEKMTDKASSHFEKMNEMNFVSNALPFTNLMDLYMKVGQPEKVPPLVQEMKRKNIPLNTYSYIIWIQSYGCLNDLENIERVIDEVQQQDSMKNDWRIYSNLATVYVKAGQFEKAESAFKQVEEISDNIENPNRGAYRQLMDFYTQKDDLKSVSRVWDKLKSKFKVCDNQCYFAMLRALSKLGDIEGLKKCWKEWESSYQSYDFRLPTAVIDGYLRHDILEEAKLLLTNVTDRAGDEPKVRYAHIFFMNYYLGKGQIDLALKHMEIAIENKWKPAIERLNPFFEYFIEEKDVDGAEKFCQMLKKIQPLDSRVYVWLLETYATAGTTTPEMRKRMEEDGVDIRTEHEELLDKVCPCSVAKPRFLHKVVKGIISVSHNMHSNQG